MTFLKKFWHGFCNIFGFHRNSKYVGDYLNTANMRSGVFMSVVIIALEAWLVVRQTNKYVIDALNIGTPFIKVFLTYLYQYFLLMFFGAAMLVYCLQYLGNKRSKKKMILTIVFAGLSLALACLFPLCFTYGNLIFNTENLVKTVKSSFSLSFYISTILFNVCIIFSTIFKYKNYKFFKFTAIATISLFALVCLTFGVMISYADFASKTEIKQIICFLTMILYVACLLIWRPYISISILGVVFLGFYFALDFVESINGGGRALPEADKLNYITFFISLSMVAISIYNQRIREARKDEELIDMATKDKLTGLYSYGYFLEQCKEKIIAENPKGGERVYLFLNLRHFKIYNDQKGYIEGNQLLKDVGEIFKECFDEGTLLTRQSDDHFMALTNTGRIVEKVEKAAEMILERTPIVRVGLNVGACLLMDTLYEPQVGVEKARYACTEIKNSRPKEKIIFFDKRMHEETTKAQYVATHIDEAIENGYIQAYFQPVVWSNGRELCGVEALARWIDPKYGFLSPGVFVPVLESSNLIYKLDKEILRIVCEKIRFNLDFQLPVLPVSINFSRADFGVINLVKTINEIVDRYKVPHELIHVEITESALTKKKDLLKETLDELHANGYAVWLDDFGSGYSSLNNLKDFEFDVLKLDMDFLRGFKGTAKEKALISCVINLAEEIGMKTLCEGVETMEQAEFLESAHCGRLQGYLYGKPLSYDELLKKIKGGEYKLSKDVIQ